MGRQAGARELGGIVICQRGDSPTSARASCTARCGLSGDGRRRAKTEALLHAPARGAAMDPVGRSAAQNCRTRSRFVALAGRPNVGKSTLANLFRRSRSSRTSRKNHAAGDPRCGDRRRLGGFVLVEPAGRAAPARRAHRADAAARTAGAFGFRQLCYGAQRRTGCGPR